MADDPVHPPAERTDHSPWNLLLLLSIVVPLLTFLYDGDEPRLFGFPRFYWMQLSFVVLGIVCTAIVYRKTRRKPGLPAQNKERQP
ncbi:MAG TPA: DUF3311 domain-containing protein [Kofleriaceae bacterium]